MIPYLNSLAHTPIILNNILHQVKQERFSERTVPNKPNLRELVAHIADYEDVVLDRLRLAQEKPGAVVESYETESRAEQKHFDERDPYHEIEVFMNRRRDLVEFLSGLSTEDWHKTFKHPKSGEQSIEEYANVILSHDLNLIAHAVTYMR
jgi:uncharacterized damage-inducible protein DinB